MNCSCTFETGNMDFPDSSLLEKEPRKSLTLECILPRHSDAFLDHEAFYECGSINPWTSCVFMCRRSPRLLSNGYYILTEDSFVSDEDGNITLSPSQTTVTYKEKIFQKRKRIHRSLVSLFNVSASNPWLNSTVCSDTDAPDDICVGGESQMDTSWYYDKEYFAVKSNCCQMIMLSMLLIIALFARFFLGGLFTTLLSCLLLITLICLLALLHSSPLDTFFCQPMRSIQDYHPFLSKPYLLQHYFWDCCMAFCSCKLHHHQQQ
ncbi:transmembrane protein 71 isoform X2 [Hemicordylus capensis]|uniref:transmembrane protein 71 isoform X2 n=1 Tax=Hemicordylus capensis TaxID=884348 RepID=UPI002303052B|nr:transmembrane protein 71 isoform X2 [Hemicordylus capensis]